MRVSNQARIWQVSGEFNMTTAQRLINVSALSDVRSDQGVKPGAFDNAV